MKPRTIYAAWFVAAGLVVVACGAKKPPPKEPPHVETVTDAGADPAEAEAPKPKSLYERLGKQEGIAKIVDTLFKNVAVDPKFNKRLANVKAPRVEKLKKDMSDQLCVESGGPESGADCKYDGRFMKELLGPKSKFKEDEWQAVLLGLRNALEEHSVQNDEQQDLAAAVGKFKDDVVDAGKKPNKK